MWAILTLCIFCVLIVALFVTLIPDDYTWARFMMVVLLSVLVFIFGGAFFSVEQSAPPDTTVHVSMIDGTEFTWEDATVEIGSQYVEIHRDGDDAYLRNDLVDSVRVVEGEAE
jgi:membrane protein implicated in regulation of membrane protease activity